MKNTIRMTGFIGIALIIGFFTVSCKTLDNAESKKLSVPKNVKIEITARQMIVTWSAVPNAQGYLIETTSENCRSGNKIINTKNGTAVMTSSGGSSLAGTDREDGIRVRATDNGAVQIHGKNKFEITLMPEWNIPGDNTSGRNESKIMATAVTAKVKAIGGSRGYSDSDYSNTVTRNIH